MNYLRVVRIRGKNWDAKLELVAASGDYVESTTSDVND
jgi:hypothetical protein